MLAPNLGELFAKRVKGLRQALEQTRVDPTDAQQNLRQLVEEIRLTPRDGVLAIDWRGNLEAGLAAAVPVGLEGSCWLRGRQPARKTSCGWCTHWTRSAISSRLTCDVSSLSMSATLGRGAGPSKTSLRERNHHSSGESSKSCSRQVST
jgi:hypothetical protein